MSGEREGGAASVAPLHELLGALHEIDEERFYPTASPDSAWSVGYGGRWYTVWFDPPFHIGNLQMAIQEAIEARGWGWWISAGRDYEAQVYPRARPLGHADEVTAVEALGWAFVKAARATKKGTE